MTDRPWVLLPIETKVREFHAKILQSAVLAERGLALVDVVKATVFLIDMDDFGAMNAVYIEMFGEDAAPARSTVEVARLPLDALVEIDAIAVLQ